jgi:PAS domain S-box-containing protein
MLFTPAFFEQIISTVSEGLFVVDANGVVLLCNPAFERLTGYSRAECVGTSCVRLGCDMCNKSREDGGEAWCVMFSSKVEDRKQCTIRHKNGAWLPVIKNARTLRMEGGGMCVVETLTDISGLLERERRIVELSRLLETETGLEGLIGTAPVMQNVYRILERAAASDAPVLLLGESGTGKELAAHAVHKLSARRERPYVSVNCAALNEAVLESELFGHVRGAFTGADRDREGRFGAADKGTLFLDEIGDTPLMTQIKLLRVLETGRYEAVGENISRTADVRLVAATNRPLEHLVRQGLFREDLLFRIKVIPVRLPPLREHMEDLPLLAGHLLERIARRKKIPAPELTAPALEFLYAHSWPGNVRELRNALEYAVALAGSQPIGAEHLPSFSSREPTLVRELGALRDAGGWEEHVPPPAGINARETVLTALEACGGNMSRAAQVLGIHRSTLHARLHRLGIRRGVYA